MRILPTLRITTPALLAVVATLALALVLAPAMTAPATAQNLKEQSEDFAHLADKLSPAVVNISSTQKVEKRRGPEAPDFPPGSPFKDFFEEFMERRGQGMPSIPPASLGSGFVFDAGNGHIVTNYHVVKGADEVRVTFHDDTTLEAEVIGRDEKTDLAVLKVDPQGQDLKQVPMGNSDAMRVGNWVMAIGNPFGLGGTVTVGIISAQQRDIRSGPYDNFIQTDASINRGNSGGPMFNLNGEVIGINTAIFSPSGGSVGIGFAIPSNLAKPVINQLIEYGRTRRGWLGVRIQTVTDEIADSLGLDEARGALVASVSPESPAKKAGIKAGDIILSFDGKQIPEMRELPRIVAETKIGKAVNVTLWRNGEKETLDVTIGELEKAEEKGLVREDYKDPDSKGQEGVALEDLGFSVESLTTSLRAQFDIAEDVEGLVVTNVEPGTEAARKLTPGDIILEVNQQETKSPGDIRDVIEQAKEAGRNSVLLLVDNQGQGNVRFVAMPFTDKDEDEDQSGEE